MSFKEILQRRSSVRKYTGEKIPEDLLEKVIEAGLMSPSGRNIKPWELVVVQNRETLEKLSHCRKGAAKMLENAGCAILVFADPEKTDVWTEDCSIVMSNMHIMADSLGLGSCWIQGRLREAENGETTEHYCRKVLNVPENMVLEAILSVGILEGEKVKKDKKIDNTKVHFEEF